MGSSARHPLNACEVAARNSRGLQGPWHDHIAVRVRATALVRSRTVLSSALASTVVAGLATSSMAGCAKAPATHSPESVPSGATAEATMVLSPPPPSRPVTAFATAAPTPTFVGALERPQALRRFFDGLAELDSGARKDDVRVVQLGDSHTVADFESGVVRRILQGRFGDGGRGFVPLGKPFPGIVVAGLRLGMKDGFVAVQDRRSRREGDGRQVDGLRGPAGLAVQTDKRGATAWVEGARGGSVEVAYLEHPKGGSFEVLVDGNRSARVSSQRGQPAAGFRAITVPEGPHRVEVRALGDGEVRIFGVSLDRPATGVIWDALGQNGARASTALRWSEPHMAEGLRHLAPTLVVVAYGTNDADGEGADTTHERELVDLLGRIARAAPTAACLVLGPPDRALRRRDGWVTSQVVLDVIGAQRRVAEAAGCAYYDRLTAMGGPGSIAAWAAEPEPRAQKDRIHLTREGYAQMGSAFAADLLRAYAAYRGERGLPPVSAPQVAMEAPVLERLQRVPGHVEGDPTEGAREASARSGGSKRTPRTPREGRPRTSHR